MSWASGKLYVMCVLDRGCVVSDIVLWSIVEFSTGVKVYDTSFAIERTLRALKMLIKLPMLLTL